MPVTFFAAGLADYLWSAPVPVVFVGLHLSELVAVFVVLNFVLSPPRSPLWL